LILKIIQEIHQTILMLSEGLRPGIGHIDELLGCRKLLIRQKSRLIDSVIQRGIRKKTIEVCPQLFADRNIIPLGPAPRRHIGVVVRADRWTRYSIIPLKVGIRGVRINLDKHGIEIIHDRL
jgi:hypothetical protein